MTSLQHSLSYIHQGHETLQLSPLLHRWRMTFSWDVQMCHVSTVEAQGPFLHTVTGMLLQPFLWRWSMQLRHNVNSLCISTRLFHSLIQKGLWAKKWGPAPMSRASARASSVPSDTLTKNKKPPERHANFFLFSWNWKLGKVELLLLCCSQNTGNPKEGVTALWAWPTILTLGGNLSPCSNWLWAVGLFFFLSINLCLKKT